MKVPGSKTIVGIRLEDLNQFFKQDMIIPVNKKFLSHFQIEDYEVKKHTIEGHNINLRQYKKPKKNQI